MNISPLIPRIIFSGLRYLRGRSVTRAAVCAVLVSTLSLPLHAANTVVRMEISFGNTPAGNIDIELYDDDAPKTVKNFLQYAGYHYHRQRASMFGNYTYKAANPVIIHRIAHQDFTDFSSPIFAIQGGGHYFVDYFSGRPIYDAIQGPSVQNEYSPSHQNAAGTIAMALSQDQAGNVLPNSATGQWFINLTNNSAMLSGYTVFGHVLDPGMDIVNAVANLPSCNKESFYSAFNELPTYNYDSNCAPGTPIPPDNLVSVSRIPNVTSVQTPSGALAIFTAGVNMTFNSAGVVDANTSELRLAEFKSPPNESLYFNNGMFALELTGVMSSADDHVVTLYDSATNRPTRYYAYGPTQDDPAPHWYDFSYDGETGAEIKSDRIILHFVDNKRGDDNYTTNDSITHTGAQAVVTSTASANAQSGGCSIAATPSQAVRGGDWIVVSLFLVFVGFLRKRAHRQQV